MVGVDVAISCINVTFTLRRADPRGDPRFRKFRVDLSGKKGEKERDDDPPSHTVSLSSLFTRTERRWCAHSTGKI